MEKWERDIKANQQMENLRKWQTAAELMMMGQQAGKAEKQGSIIQLNKNMNNEGKEGRVELERVLTMMTRWKMGDGKMVELITLGKYGTSVELNLKECDRTRGACTVSANA